MGNRQLADDEVVYGEYITIGGYVYMVTVYSIGRFNIHIQNGEDDRYGYYIAGDKLKKFEMSALLAQIEGIVLQHAPNNRRIREVIKTYWPIRKWRTKQVKNWKQDFSGLLD